MLRRLGDVECVPRNPCEDQHAHETYQSIEYTGYRGKADFSDEDGVFHGRVLGIEDVVTCSATERG